MALRRQFIDKEGGAGGYDEDPGPFNGPISPIMGPQEPVIEPFGPIEGAPKQSEEGPRDRPAGGGVGLRGGGAAGAPRRPMSPTPMAGATAVPPVPAVQPFAPLPNAPGGLLATSRRRGLYGSAGGLTGGGLGVPLDPVSNAQSDPIEGLLQQLFKLQR